MKPEWNYRILVLFSLTIIFIFSSCILIAQNTFNKSKITDCTQNDE